MRISIIVKDIVRTLLWIASLPTLPALLVFSGHRVFVAFTDGAVRFLNQDHLLTCQGEPVGFVLAVAFYALTAALSFALLAFWFLKQPMRLESSLALIGTILFGIVLGTCGIVMAPVVTKARTILAPVFAKAPPIERPLAVQALKLTGRLPPGRAPAANLMISVLHPSAVIKNTISF